MFSAPPPPFIQTPRLLYFAKISDTPFYPDTPTIQDLRAVARSPHQTGDSRVLALYHATNRFSLAFSEFLLIQFSNLLQLFKADSNF